MAKQSALGGQKIERTPGFVKTDIGRVTANDRYEKFGIIEVVMLDHSSPFPVWVVGDIDRKPMTGDHVIISYISGRKDAPYLVGHVKNKSYTTNFIEVDEKHIRVQLPVMEVGKKDKKAHNDTKKFLRDSTKLKERAYLELFEDHVKVYHPVGKDEVDNGAYIEFRMDGMKMYHPVGLDDDGAYVEMTSAMTEIYHPTGNVRINVPNGILDVI